MTDRETHEQRVERLARAVYASTLQQLWPFDSASWPLPPSEDAKIMGVPAMDFCRVLAAAIIASDREAGYVTVPVDLLKDCADDLEAWVRFAYPEDSRKYPSEARRDERDMEPAVRLRAAIAAHEQEERQDAP